MRRLYDLPRTAHTRLLSNITNLPHVKHNLKCRFIKFVNSATKSCNNKVNILAKLCINDTFYVTGQNGYKISIIDIIYVINVYALMNKLNIKSNNIDKEKWKCNIILEILECMYGLSNCGISIDEARHCLIYASTM